jgi:hypothetical protein
MSLLHIYISFYNYFSSPSESRISTSAWNLTSYILAIINFNAKQYGAQMLYKINKYLAFTVFRSFWLQNKIKKTECPRTAERYAEARVNIRAQNYIHVYWGV